MFSTVQSDAGPLLTICCCLEELSNNVKVFHKNGRDRGKELGFRLLAQLGEYNVWMSLPTLQGVANLSRDFLLCQVYRAGMSLDCQDR